MGMKHARVGAVLAESVNGFFLRVAIDFGLATWAFPGLHALVNTGDELKMDLLAGDVTNLATGNTAKVEGKAEANGKCRRHARYGDTGVSSVPADLGLGSKAKFDFDGMTAAGAKRSFAAKNTSGKRPRSWQSRFSFVHIGT
jgi:hypothetical protein